MITKLIFTFLDVVESVMPRAFVMENVKALGVLEKWEPVRKNPLLQIYETDWIVGLIFVML